MRVIVIGAGVLGSSITYQLAKRGVDVTIIDKSIPGDAASAASFAWINSNDKADPREWHNLSAMSIGEWNLLAREVGTTSWLHRDGNLHIVDNPADAEDLLRIVEQSHSLGYAAVPIPLRDLSRLEPQLRARPEYELAVFFPEEGHITIPLLIHDLLGAATSLGSQLRHSTTVTDLHRSGDQVTGVILDDGTRLEADLVVLAAGAGIGDLLGKQGVDAQTKGTPGITVTTSPGTSNVSTMLHLPGLSIRPDTSGRIVVRSSAADREIDLATWTLPDHAIRRLFEQAAAAVVDVDSALVRSERVQIAHRPYPLDGLPVIGEWDGVPGLYVTTMHSGVTLGAITGRLAAEEIASGEKSALLQAFRPSRIIDAATSGAVHFDPYAVEREKQPTL
ncbi:D-amino-acid oxidase [Leifsonia sp. LS1]|uniref:NAD(P)/FAD-dependent oxidoreductase n=1 Tax=Leifsonia sp. LS1 TaxID=2828483 RepID=UPI001CFCB75C|nr:FAD-binding oxidoreductase [Leifsonia sp. LS1]GIT82046.1 D-amino-acid oxidase [Leifsonia sp. LS1]